MNIDTCGWPKVTPPIQLLKDLQLKNNEKRIRNEEIIRTITIS